MGGRGIDDAAPDDAAPAPASAALDVDGQGDAALVEAARTGDFDAWVVLYRRVHPRLRAYLARRVGPQHAEDAVSDTVCRAVASIGRLHVGPAGFDGWVFGIARRVAADHHRRAARARRPIPAATAVPVEPGEDLDRSEEHRGVRRAFDRLSGAEQELLELRVVAGLSADQVAAVLGKRAGAVRTAQSRALAHLRRLMEEDDTDG